MNRDLTALQACGGQKRRGHGSSPVPETLLIWESVLEGEDWGGGGSQGIDITCIIYF